MACSPASVEHGVQERKKLEVMVCGREWRASMTQSGRMWVHTGCLDCLASEPLSYAGVSSLVDVLVRSQILTPLTPNRKVTELWPQQCTTKAMSPLRILSLQQMTQGSRWLWVILEGAPVGSHGGGGYVRPKPRGSSPLTRLLLGKTWMRFWLPNFSWSLTISWA